MLFETMIAKRSEKIRPASAFSFFKREHGQTIRVVLVAHSHLDVLIDIDYTYVTVSVHLILVRSPDVQLSISPSLSSSHSVRPINDV